MSPGRPLRSKEIADQMGVSTDTLRHYERLGLLSHPPRTESGYRQYSNEAVQRIALIRRALSVGFSLTEIGEILAIRDRGGAPCKKVHALAQEKLTQVGEQILSLEEVRDGLRDLLKDWSKRLESTADGKRAGLLEGAGLAARAKPKKQFLNRKGGNL